MRRITSRQNPIVARFKAIASGDEPGLLLDGPHLVSDALGAPLRIRQALVTMGGLERDDIKRLVLQLERSGADVVSVPPAVMAAVSPVRSPSALVAVADRPTISIDRIYTGKPLVVIACDIQDPGNLGAIVRVAEAAGGTGVVAAGRGADPYGPKALRGSMGSALRLPIVASEASHAVSQAQAQGCRVLAAVPREGRSVFDLDLSGAVAILIGSEGAGLPVSLVTAADERVTIPMQADVESLNAAVTAAVVLYEAYRQRNTHS